MSLATTNYNPSHARNPICEGFHSFRVAAETTFNDTVPKVQDFIESPIGQGMIGFGLGLGMHLAYGPITERILTAMGYVVSDSGGADPFMSMGLPSKILLMPLICILGPIQEELGFRGGLQGFLKDAFESFYLDRGLENSAANMAARVTSVFVTSVIFGLVHFSNAIIFWCNPVLFLPQV
ncbi:MAG: CPBP family intramembrane metalloprotease, partial [Verrucomicrobia bacterium]|nr:CPBP family intramembrane metalloprotease [Verrucomicrobiota bacterium]